MRERKSNRRMQDGTIHLFTTVDSVIYMHPADITPEEANKHRHYGHNDWQTPDIATLSAIFSKLDKGDFSKAVSESFNDNAIYTATPRRKVERLWTVERGPEGTKKDMLIRPIRIAPKK